MEPTHDDDEWISLPVRPGTMEVQTADGACVAIVYGSTPDEAEARADQIASVPLFLAYAECQEAQERWDHEVGYGKADLDAVFVRHGLEAPTSRWHGNDQLAALRRAALAKARPVPIGVVNSPEMVP